MAEKILETGIIAYQQGEPERAMGIFSKILKQEPNNADAWFWLGRCQQDTEKAKFCFERSAFLNQQLTSREYIYVDPDDAPKTAKPESHENPAPTYEDLNLHAPIPREMAPAGAGMFAKEREINPFLAYPLPEGFVYPRNKNNKLEIALAILLGVLLLILLIALLMRYM